MRMKRSFHSLLGTTLLLSFSLSALGCATTNNDKRDLTPKEVARFQEEIDRHPSSVPIGTEINVSVTGEMPKAVPAKPAVSRDFTVPAAEYDAFFADSPAVVLGRVTLDPVRDGSALLGYKIVKFNRGKFEGVDLVENDIIVAIDGKLPKNPDDYFATWEKLKAANTATVKVQRSVDTFTLTWKKSL
jgi:type II secretory pathway component PulC